MGLSALERIVHSQGFGSRKECRGLIAAGRISLDGELQLDADFLLDPAGRRLDVDGVGWPWFQRLYLALNKPSGYECSRAPSGHPAIFDLLPDHFVRRGVQSAGRLDWDTRGLLLLSDDGDFLHALTAPKRHLPKTYRALTARPLDADQLAQLRAGVVLRDDPAPVKALGCRQVDEFRLELTIGEGKYHQVKRMIAAAGNHCQALERVAVGDLRLEDLDLAEGAWTYIDPRSIAR
jgi:16S rRNA pseudouridine516 synthase